MIGKKTAIAWMLGFFSLPVWMLLLIISAPSGNLLTVWLWVLVTDVVALLVASVSLCTQLLRGR